jgi:hypothetical protein
VLEQAGPQTGLVGESVALAATVPWPLPVLSNSMIEAAR